MELQVVTLVCENAACGEQMAALGHVKRLVSWFLLDFHAIPLAEAVNHKDLALFDLLIGTGEEHLGKGLDDTQLVACMKAAISSGQVEFFEALMTCGSVCWYPDWFKSGEMVEWTARHGNLPFLQSIHRHRPSWCGSPKSTTDTEAEEQEALGDVASTAVAVALGFDHREIVRYLLEHFEICCGPCLMEQALRMGHFQCAFWFFQLDGNETLRANKTRSCAMHIRIATSTFEEWLTLVSQSAVSGSLHELQWLQEHFPHIRLQTCDRMLVMASSCGDLDRVKWLLERAVDPPHDESSLQEAMKAACRGGHLGVVEFLILRGQKVYYLDEAVEGGNLALVKFLQQKCGVHRFKSMDEAIDEAASRGHLELLQSLEPERQRPYPIKAFRRAAWTGDSRMLRFLTSHSYDSNLLVKSLNEALECGQCEVVKLLYGEVLKNERSEYLTHKLWDSMDVEARVEMYKTTDHLDALCFLLFHELDQKRESPSFMRAYQMAIRVAMRFRDLPTLRHLHRQFRDPFAAFALSQAVETGSLGIVQFFLNVVLQKPDLYAMGQAAANGNLRLVEFLHQHCGEECTLGAMQNAAEKGHWKVVRYLHQHLAEHEDLSCILTTAIEFNHLQVAKYLWSVQDQQQSNAKELLQEACVSCCLPIVQWLVETNDDTLDDDAYEEALSTAEWEGIADVEQKRQTISFLEARRRQLCLKRRRVDP